MKRLQYLEPELDGYHSENVMIYLPEKKMSSENQRKYTQKLCEIRNTLWKRDMVTRRE